jgi:hypothetical protein
MPAPRLSGCSDYLVATWPARGLVLLAEGEAAAAMIRAASVTACMIALDPSPPSAARRTAAASSIVVLSQGMRMSPRLLGSATAS